MQTTATDRKAFHLPQKPFDVVAMVNRIALATGSMSGAAAGESAPCNGHANVVSWNRLRGYYVGEYFWAGRQVWCRTSSFSEALARALAEFDRQGAGATMVIVPRPQDVHVAEACPRLMTPEAAEAVRMTWWTWKHDEAATALRMQRLFGTPDVAHLIAAADPADYEARVRADIRRRSV
jgi:hypothetical protein